MAKPKSLRRQRKRTLEKGRPGMGKVYLGACAAVFYPLTSLLARVRLLGLERIPAEGPAMLVFNHVSHLDPIYDAVAVHQAGRVPRFLAKNTLWNNPVVGSVLSGVDQIPVYRGTADAYKSLRAAHEALESDKTLLIYPDGTITKDPQGWPMTPKVGVARLALEHDVPVIPVARWGTRQIYDHYEKKFRPLPRKQVTFQFGDPVDLSEYGGRQVDNQLLREVAQLIMSRVRGHLGEIRELPPPHGFYSVANKSGSNDHD